MHDMTRVGLRIAKGLPSMRTPQLPSSFPEIRAHQGKGHERILYVSLHSIWAGICPLLPWPLSLATVSRIALFFFVGPFLPLFPFFPSSPYTPRSTVYASFCGFAEKPARRRVSPLWLVFPPFGRWHCLPPSPTTSHMSARTQATIPQFFFFFFFFLGSRGRGLPNIAFPLLL